MSMSLEEYMEKHLATPDVTEINLDALCPACLMSAILNPVAGDSGETWLT
jgi:hypothetical protein